MPELGRFDGRRYPFAACGERVTIYEWARILDPERVTMGSDIVIDDFVFFDGGERTTMGSFIHMAAHSSVMGGGELVLGDHCGWGAGVRVITGSELFDGSCLPGVSIPADLRSVHRGRVELEPFSVLASNVVVHPDVVVGEGAVVGSGSVVTHDVEPWTINLGTPARPVKDRPRDEILRRARILDERRAEVAGQRGDQSPLGK